MKRRDVLCWLGAPALLSSAPVSAQAKVKVTYGYLLDPAYDAVTWAMRNGKISSDSIEVEARALAIPQLIQATAAKQYDVIMTAVIGLPAAVQRGLDLRILSTALRGQAAGEGAGVWVRADSPIKTAADLRGKTLGSYGLRSTGYTQVRIALAHKHGLNVALEGGDIKQVEIPAPNLPAALSAKQVDAATLIHSQAYKAAKSGDFRLVVETARDNVEAFKTRFISAVNVGYVDRLTKNPQHHLEFCRMFVASKNYALAHRQEVFGAVAKESGLDIGFFDWWFDKSQDVPGTFTAEHQQAITRFFEQAKAIDAVKEVPDVHALVWDKAPSA